MLRLRVTDLESYRYWKANEDGDVASLVSRLMHRDPPTSQMMAGRAFAKLMEHAGDGDIDRATVEGWTFVFDVDTTLVLPRHRELKAEVEMQTPSGPVTLAGQVDAMEGLRIHDAKLTERFDAERYLDSLQWRAYLTMFHARAFVYDIFVGRYEEDQTVRIVEYHRLPFYAYPAMAADVQRAVDELAAIMTEHVLPAVESERQAAAG